MLTNLPRLAIELETITTAQVADVAAAAISELIDRLADERRSDSIAAVLALDDIAALCRNIARSH